MLGVLDGAAAWLQAIGVSEQWPASFSEDPVWVERFRRWTHDGRVFLARDEGGIAVACFRLMDSDVHIWQDDGSEGNVYLHSLAVRREVAGQGITPVIFDWAVQYAVSRGAEELRLDCWAGNERLVRYYEGAGFEPRGTQHVSEGESGVWDMQEYWVAKFARPCR